MKTIYKAVLDVLDEQVVVLREGCRVLTVREQGNNICIWFEVDPASDFEDRVIYIVGTGNPIPEEANNYLGTAQIHGGSLIFHVYE